MSGEPGLRGGTHVNPDDQAGETMRVHPLEPRRYESRPSVTPYLYAPPRQRSIAPLVMVTVMVLTVVAGTVTVVYLLTGDRGAAPPPPSVSATAGVSGAVDGCVIGEWLGTATTLDDPDEGTSMSTGTGAVYRLRADATGELDFGGGLSFTGTLKGVKNSEVMYIGRVTFRYATSEGTLSYSDLRVDARMLTFQAGRVVANVRVPADEFGPERYTCAGDLLTVVSDGVPDRYRRR